MYNNLLCNRQLPAPAELSQQLLSDAAMEPMYGRIVKSLDYAQVTQSAAIVG